MSRKVNWKPVGFYVKIADEYRRLVAAGDRSPIVSIATIYDVSRDTAMHWIRHARSHGILEPATPRGHHKPRVQLNLPETSLQCGCSWYYLHCPPKSGEIVTCRHHGPTKVIGETRARNEHDRTGNRRTA